MSYQLNYRSLIRALLFDIDIINSLFTKHEKYTSLLRELSKYEINEGEVPYQKELLKKLNLKRKELMKLMNKLYQEFKTKLNNPHTYPVQNTEIWLLCTTIEDFWAIGMDDMNYIPRVGDIFNVPFIRDKYGSGLFYVNRIKHELENGVHKILIFLEDRINQE